MKKILVIITTAFYTYGGLASVMLNYYRTMDKSGLQIDFASSNELEEDLVLELRNNHSNYYKIGSRQKETLRYMVNLMKLLRNGRYDVVHVNGNSATMAMDLCMARLFGIPFRIAHVHSTATMHPVFNTLLRPVLQVSSNKQIAVSKDSGDWLFRRGSYIVLNNAIPIRKYVYNAEIRKEYRKKFGLQDMFVVGNVGKLNKQKNHRFLLEIFWEMKKHERDAVLLIVGGGELEETLKIQADELGIGESVIFTGMRKDVENMLQAMDCFVFTSIYEGLGMALIEAQAAGLYCISSDEVPEETNMSDNIEYMCLSDLPQKWAQRVLQIRAQTAERMTLSEKAVKRIKESGYDISTEANKLREIYLMRSRLD